MSPVLGQSEKGISIRGIGSVDREYCISMLLLLYIYSTVFFHLFIFSFFHFFLIILANLL